MKKSVFIFLFLIRSFLHTDAQTVIVYPDGYSMKEQLAAKEIRKYIYLCSGELLELRSLNELPESGDYILVSSSDRSLMTSVETQVNHEIQPHGFVIKSIALKNQNILIISGYDPTATLHAAYRLAEHLGVGFDLAGDIIPDSKIKFDISGFCYLLSNKCV